MLEIGSFNELFVAAKNGKFLMAAFYQDDSDFFYCQWRRGEELGPELKRRLPFNAALDSFLALRDATSESEEKPPESDLFD